jgi:hypothetical protein
MLSTLFWDRFVDFWWGLLRQRPVELMEVSAALFGGSLFAMMFYASASGAVWTCVYFVAAIFRLMELPPESPLSADLASQIAHWVNP